MDVILIPLLQVFNAIIGLYIWAVIINVVLNWLVAFNIINTYNRFVIVVSDILYRLTEPALAPIRRFMPNLGGLDLSPLALILLLYFIQGVVTQLAFRLAGL